MTLKAPYDRSDGAFRPFNRVKRSHNDRMRSAILMLLTLVFAELLAAATAQAITVDQANQINQGFNLFTAETFNGNGRTCGTCHLSQADFTISPADLATLSAHDKALVFGTNVAPGNALTGSLENPTLLQKLGLFNENASVGGAPQEIGSGDTPAGPFRASMPIGGLAFTTSNLLPDFCSSSSPPAFIENGTTVDCGTLPGEFPNLATAITLTEVFLNTLPPTYGDLAPGVDEGTRNVELGWSGDGFITDPNVFGNDTTSMNQDCKEAVNEANADTTDLTKSLSAFALTAVKTHFPKTLNRVPGIDFRCPTMDELNAMAAFQEYLGRRFELALKAGVPTDADDATNVSSNFAAGTQTDPLQPVITFHNGKAEKGKAIFLDGNSQCNLCHFNAGANDAAGLTHAPNVNDPSAPFPGRNFTAKQLVDLLRCADPTGDPTTCLIPTSAHGLNNIVQPVVFPQDPGDGVSNGAAPLGGACTNTGGNSGCVDANSLKEGAFNIQPLIGAARKKSFFHDGAFNTLEDAISFYFSPTGDLIKAFQDPRKSETGAQALGTLANTYFSDPSDTQDVINTIGFFLRALSVVYSIGDCERLVNDSIDLVNKGMPTDVQVLLCTGDLNDISRVLVGAQVKLPGRYKALQIQAAHLVGRLQNAAARNNVSRLRGILRELHSMRESIATITPELPY